MPPLFLYDLHDLISKKLLLDNCHFAYCIIYLDNVKQRLKNRPFQAQCTYRDHITDIAIK